MGLLRDTYITFKNDPSGQYAIADQMKQKNKIEQEQMILLKNTRDRVDISLQKYEKLKTDLQDANCLINDYQAFIRELAKAIKCDPHVLLKSKIVYNKLERQPQYMNFVLYIGFEIDPKITED